MFTTPQVLPARQRTQGSAAKPVIAGMLALLLSLPMGAAATQPPTPQDPPLANPMEQRQVAAQHVDLVLALDVSGSMSGLINSAKQRLWDVVNALGQAQPSPNLRVAIITFGKPSYGADNGYVQINQPLTSDLDAVNRALFSFQTDGGSEYVARAIHRSLTELDWNQAPNTSKVLFVAGNESAAQDPEFSLEQVAAQAQAQGLVVNAIFCGSSQRGDATSWAKIAQLGGGMYAAIDQQAGAIALRSTPMDKTIAKLNQELNATYLAYGADGKAAAANQQTQDHNSQRMSEAALVSRTLTKASKLYRNQGWDLLDAIEAGTALEDIPEQDLPASLQPLSPQERDQFLADAKAKREALQVEIGRLGEERQAYLQANAPSSVEGSQTLDTALKAGLQKALQGATSQP